MKQSKYSHEAKCKWNPSKALQINAIARNRPNPKSEKSQTLFSLAWVDRACIQDSPALNIIENGAVDQKI